MSDTNQAEIQPQRLCSEIQLFDLCELSTCRFRQGRFCSDPELLLKFERISEQDMRVPERFIEDDEDEADLDNETYDEYSDEDDCEDDGYKE